MTMVDDITGHGSTRTSDLSMNRLSVLSLRLGLAFVFLYAAVSSFLHPETFAAYFPTFLPSSWATELLPVFGVYEVVLGVALMAGRQTYRAAVLSALTLVAIVAANPDAFEVLFRNVAIACAALALAAQTRPDRGPVTSVVAADAAETGPFNPEARTEL